MGALAAKPVTFGLDEWAARFSVTQYQRMVESGILTNEDKVELLENYVILKIPTNPQHCAAIQRLGRLFQRLIPPGWDVRLQMSVELADSQPEPDCALVRGTVDDYEDRHPVAGDVGLVIEVANTSLLRDQRDKTRIYARASIATYWIVNLVDRRVEVYTNPTGPTAVPAYQTFQTFQPGDVISFTLDGAPLQLNVADLIP